MSIAPDQASSLRVGHVMMIREHACKIVNMATSKTGKHGGAKIRITALDIFDDTKHETIAKTTHDVMVPEVTKSEYVLVDISDDGFMTLMSVGGVTREDLRLLPNDELSAQIREQFSTAGNEITIVVQAAIGREKVVQIK